MPAQRIERAERGPAPHHELLGEVEVRPGKKDPPAQRRRVLEPVDDQIEVAALQRGDEVRPVVLHEALAQTELPGERAHQLHLESDQLRWIARVAKDIRLAALEVSGPADLALRADPGKPRCRDEERQRQGGHRHR